MELETVCVHGTAAHESPFGAVAVPIFQSATFAHTGGVSTGYDYSRLQNPTREAVEHQLNALEGGTDTVAFSSGMAAMTTLMELFSPGDHIVVTDDLYGGSIRLLNSVSKKNGLLFDYTDTANIDNIRQLLKPNTKALFIETPTNPMMRVTDISAAAKLMHGHNPDAVVIVDNTFLSPYFCRPLKLGADIVLHSGTKYLGGHNDTLAGFLVQGNILLAEKIRFLSKTTGAGLAPFDSFLIGRGIKTLALRMEKSQRSALDIARWLLGQKKIVKVHYVGLPEHPGYELSKRQTSGFGAMLSFETDTAATARAMLNNIKLIQFAESLGGTESLLTFPLTQTHADVPEAERLARGITDRLLRMSVGIENVTDLIEDLNQAINR